MQKKYIWCILLFSIGYISQAQKLRKPMDLPALLSGAFGELRSNHFHSGLDFKTQGVVGQPIHAVTDGYVSRISVNAWGYGNCLYLTHPNGITTVYGHLLRFSPEIESYVKDMQYTIEQFQIDMPIDSALFPVKKGDVIAWSGNTGSSGGPHLHFEIRKTKSEEPIDPISYYKDEIKDNRPPRIKGVMICPIEGKGVVNNSSQPIPLKLVTAKNGKQTIVGKIKAWGEIGLAVSAYDYMNNTNNIYGVKEVKLFNDSSLIYHSYLDKFRFDESHYINSYTLYDIYKTKRKFYMCSFVEPGNQLRFIKAKNRGIVTIDQEREYHFTYLLTDAYGNTKKLSIWVSGKKQAIAPIDTTNTQLFKWNQLNRFSANGIQLEIPRWNLYNNLYFKFQKKIDTTQVAAIYQLHTTPTPLHQKATLNMRIDTDTILNKSRYGIVMIKKNTSYWKGGTYRKGWIQANITELGYKYTIAIDTKKPRIIPLAPSSWRSRRKIRFKLRDDLSGIKTFRGEIDGQFPNHPSSYR